MTTSPVPGYDDEELAALYDLFFGDYDGDLGMYENFARRGEGPVLEIAAGTGRVALHLARAGFDVVALDAAPAMLRRLRTAADSDAAIAGKVRIVEGDMRSFALGERFDLIICALNSFQHLTTTGEQIACLECVSEHLAPGGLFVMEIQSPAHVSWDETGAPLQFAGTRCDPATGEEIVRFYTREVEPATLLRHSTYIFDRTMRDGTLRRRTFRYALKYSTPDELRLVTAAARLRLTRVYGDYELSPFTGSSDNLIAVVEREAS